MKRLCKTLGAIILGMILMAGCGDKQAEVLAGIQTADISGGVTQNNGANSREQSGRGQSGGEQNGKRITLTLGTMGSVNLQIAVDAYNAQSEKYYIEIVDYQPEHYDNTIYEAAEDRFRMELATGKGTDIISFGNLVVEDLGYAGVLVDLNTFLDSEEKKGKYLENILECVQTGEALYEISPAFILEFIVGDGSRIGMENGWTLAEMQESFERNGRDGSALGKGGVRTVASLAGYSIEDYLDWDKGTADFCNEQFYRVLEFGKETDNGQFVRPTRESIASGTHLASCEMFVSPADIQKLNWLFGDNMVVKGYPSSHGTGVAVRMDGSLGICSYSQCPEGAWDFLEYYVSAIWTEREFYAEDILIKEDYSRYFNGFPVSRQLFEEILAQSMEQRYWEGERITLLQGEGEIPDFYANTAEDVEKVREIIALADRRSISSQWAIIQIIEEEISGYNSGVLTAEQTADKIQNRVQLYLDEQK